MGVLIKALPTLLQIVGVVLRMFEHRALRQAGADEVIADWLEKERARVLEAREAANRGRGNFDRTGGLPGGDDPFARD